MWTRSETEITIDWIRHGKTMGNEKHCYIGTTDEALSAKGIEELEIAKRNKVYPYVPFLFSSPMKRCVKTAEILYQQSPVTIDEWREIDFGDFEGKSYYELKNNASYQAWIDSNGALPFPNGESKENFIERSWKGFSKMIAILQEKSCEHTIHAAAIVHGGTIMSVLSRLTGGEYFDFQVNNAKGYRTRLKIDSKKITVIECKEF